MKPDSCDERVPVTPEMLYGVHVRLEGGEETCLVDPSTTASPMPDASAPSEVTPEMVYGVYVRLEGGEEKSLVPLADLDVSTPSPPKAAG